MTEFQNDPLRDARSAKLAGALEDARNACLAVLSTPPASLAALQLLIDIDIAAKKSAAAAETLSNLAQEQPDNIQIDRALGELLRRLQRPTEAMKHLEKAIIGGFDDPDTFNQLARAQVQAGQEAAAQATLERATVLHPLNPTAWRKLGHFFFERGAREAAAENAFQKAVALDPADAYSRFNLGVLHRTRHDYLGALRWFEEAHAVAPGDPELILALAQTQGQLGQVQDALAALTRIETWLTQSSARHSTALFTRLQIDSDRKRVYQAHLKFGEAWADVKPLTPPRRPAAQAGPIRIGYVSGDFRRHVIADFIEPVLTHHDRSAFEVFLYSTALNRDAVSDRIAAQGHWRDISRLNDPSAAQRIAEDNIDILIDLSGHTARNRLPVFALKPAPIQVSWLGYPGTTGLAQMDYRLSDARLAGPQTQSYIREKLFLLREASATYRPLPAIPLSPPPMLEAGYPTFGSTNAISKITADVVALWSQVLNAVPGSRLKLKAHGLGDPAHQAWMSARFSAAGLDPVRLAFEDASPHDEYLRAYSSIDILLDPFPYTGGTTTRGALWMGVPVITLEGEAMHERVSAAMLRTLDLGDCIASSPQDYVEAAVRLTSDPDRLAALRPTLRPRLLKTNLFDNAQATRALEEAFRTMWQNHLRKFPSPDDPDKR